MATDQHLGRTKQLIAIRECFSESHASHIFGKEPFFILENMNRLRDKANHMQMQDKCSFYLGGLKF